MIACRRSLPNWFTRPVAVISREQRRGGGGKGRDRDDTDRVPKRYRSRSSAAWSRASAIPAATPPA